MLWTSCESLSDSVEENQKRDNGDWRVDNGRQTKNERWTYRNSAGRAYYISSAQHCGGVAVYEHIKQSCRRRLRFTTRPSDSGTVLTGHGKSVRVSDWTRLGAWWPDTECRSQRWLKSTDIFFGKSQIDLDTALLGECRYEDVVETVEELSTWDTF